MEKGVFGNANGGIVAARDNGEGAFVRYLGFDAAITGRDIGRTGAGSGAGGGVIDDGDAAGMVTGSMIGAAGCSAGVLENGTMTAGVR